MTDAAAPHDPLLAALDQLTNIVYWYLARRPLTAIEAIGEAIEDWISDQAAEHHRSRPFTDADSGDNLADSLTNLLAAVAHLHRGPRPGLTAADALTEAIEDWTAGHAAVHHHSEPFQKPTAP